MDLLEESVTMSRIPPWITSIDSWDCHRRWLRHTVARTVSDELNRSAQDDYQITIFQQTPSATNRFYELGRKIPRPFTIRQAHQSWWWIHPVRGLAVSLVFTTLFVFWLNLNWIATYKNYFSVMKVELRKCNSSNELFINSTF